MEATVTEAQCCFDTQDGFKVCNWIRRNGVPTFTSSGKWWKFRSKRRKKKTEKALAALSQ